MVDESEAAVPPIAKTRLIRSRRQMYLQIVAATVILACGIIIGSGGALLHFKDDIVPDRLPPSREIARDIRTRYALTEEQTEKVEAAIGASILLTNTHVGKGRRSLDHTLRRNKLCL